MSITKEIFGIERKSCNCEAWEKYCTCDYRGFNQSLDLIDQYELSEEELAKSIYDEIYFNTGHGLVLAHKIAKAIIQNKNNIFVRKGKV